MSDRVQFDLRACGRVYDAGGDYTRPLDLVARAATVRASLDAAGVGAGDTVMLAGERGADFFARLFAAWSAGCRVACVNDRLTAPEWDNLIAFVRPAAVFPPVPGTVDCMLLADDAAHVHGNAGTLVIDVPEDADALILFTSGTTAAPKGVVHTFGSLARRLHENRRRIARDTLARTLCLLPIHFGHGLIGNALTPLLAGGDVFLADGSDVRTLARAGDIIDDLGIRFMSSVPAMWHLVLKFASPPRRGSLRQVHVGSAPVSAKLLEDVAAWCGTRNVRNLYGLTETANWVAGYSLADGAAEDGLVGAPWGGRAAVLDVHGTILPAGEGEILLQPPSLMRGYLDRPDLTGAAFHHGWLRSGDSGSIDEHGRIRLRGRRSFEINRAGIKIAPEEIDLLLERHPAVAEACAFGIDDAVAGELVAVAVRPHDDADPAELERWCRQRIRPECVPARWYLVSELARNERGKLDRRAVRAACLETVP